MSIEDPRPPLPVPRIARDLVRRSGSLAARDLGGLDRLDPHILIYGSPDRVNCVVTPALDNVGWKGHKLIGESDPLAFMRRATAASVQAAVVLPEPGALLTTTMAPLRGFIDRLRERVPSVLVDCPTADLPEAFLSGFDLATPPLHGIYPVADVFDDARRLRALFGHGAGQGGLSAATLDGRQPLPGRVLVVQESGAHLDTVAEQLIGLGCDWEHCERGIKALHTMLHGTRRWDLILMEDVVSGVQGLDLLRVLRQGSARPPPVVLHARSLSSSLAEVAWHAGAWAWCPSEHLVEGGLADLLRRGMNLCRARRRDA